MSWLTENKSMDEITGALEQLRGTELYAQAVDYAGGDEWFGLWLWLVNRRVSRAAGVSLWDLGDCMLRDAYDAGVSPAQAARDALAGDELFSFVFGGE